MSKYNIINRLIAVVCAAALLFSVVNISIFTFASGGITAITQESSNYKALENEQPKLDSYESNLLKGQLNETGFYKDGVLTDELSSDSLKDSCFDSVTNGDEQLLKCSHKSNDNCSAAGAGNEVSQNASYIQLLFKISGKINNPEKFVFQFHYKLNNKYARSYKSAHYAVFASSDYSSLYNNKIIEIENNTDRLADEIDISSLNLTNISFVAVRIYHRGYTLPNTDITGQFITELGFFGGSINRDMSVKTSAALKAADLAAVTAENRLSGSGFDVSFYKGGSQLGGEVTDSDYAKLADGSFAASIGVGRWTHKDGCHLTDAPNDIYQTDTYIQIDAEMANPISDPAEFIIAFHEKDAGARLRSQHYAVFASDNKSTLYTEEKKIIEITDTAQRTGDKIDLSSRSDIKGVKYIGIRFYNRGYSENGHIGVLQHLAEIGMYGGTVDAVKPNTPVKNKSDADISGENILERATCSGGFFSNGARTNEYSTYGIGGALGAWHKEGSVCYTKGLPNDETQTDNFWQLQIALPGKLSNPERFVFLAHDKADYLMSGHYAVFVSGSASDLYNEENKLFEVTDATKRLGDQVDLTKLNKAVSDISFVGIRFYQRGYTNNVGCSMQHISLIGLYGGDFKENTVEVRHYFTSGQYSENQLKEDIKNIGSDLIAGKQPTVKVNNSSPIVNISLGKVTDMKFDSHVDYSAYTGQKDGTCDFIYKLDNDPDVIKLIKKFIFRGQSKDSSYADQYITGKYEVYAAVNYTELFDAENMVYSYDYEQDGVSRIQTAAFKNNIYARYVAVRIINPVTTCIDSSNCYPRITEIAFLGENAVVSDEVKKVSDNMPIDIYLTDKRNNKNLISDSVTLDMYDALTDGDTATGVEFKTDGGQLDIVVNLLKDYRVTKIAASIAENGNYKAYAAQKLSDVWNEGFEVTKDGAGNLNTEATARYIRISVRSSGDKLTVNDISIEGYANPLIKSYEHLGYVLGNDSVTTFVKAINSTDNSSIEYLTNNFSNTFDGDESIEDTALIEGGVSGQSTLNILVKLSGLQSLNELSVCFTPHLIRYQPTKVNVYIGETYDEAMDFTASPTFTYNGLPELGKYYSRFKPMLARYVRIEIVNNNYGLGTTNIIGEADEDYFNQNKIAVALSEIDIMGTSVLGMASDDGKLLSFEESGVKWDIMALDENDVPSNIYSSKLVVVKATDAQKKSLYNDPYYKVADDKCYAIEFYDIFGKKLESIGERTVSVTFPVNTAVQTMAGNATSASAITMYDASAADGSITVTEKYTDGLKFALLLLTDSEDSYWNEINNSSQPDNNTDNSNTASGGNNNTTDTKKPDNNTADTSSEPSGDNANTERKTKLVDAGKETKYTVSYPGVPVWLIVLLCIEGALLAAAVFGIIFIQLKKGGKIKGFKGK